MNKLYTTLKHMAGLAAFATPMLLAAQVSLYEFSESVGTYTEITDADGGWSLGVPTYWPHVNNNRAWVNNPFNDPDGQVTGSGYLNPAIGPGYPIGFDFTFNGDVFDVIGISNGGWIGFGKSSDNLQAVWVYNWSGTSNGDPFIQWYNGPEPSYKRNRVAGFGNSSLQQVDWTSLVPPGQYSKLRMATIGTAPNRVCVVQWEDYGLRNDVTVAMNKINFQIRLYEIDNSVEVVFGPMDWVSALGRYQRTQIGLSGRTNADFNGRMTVYEQPAFLYDWNNTEPADTNTAFCQFATPQPGQPNGSGIPPEEGLTWRWTPPACPAPAWPLTITEVTFQSALVTWGPTPAGEYGYFVSTENDINGPEVASGTTTDPELVIEGLDPLTTYYVFVWSICDGEPGAALGNPFRTLGGGFVVCDGTSLEVEYCSHQYDTIQWNYVSDDGSPLKIEFLGGVVGTAGSESFKIWDGGSPTGTPGFVGSGDLTGHSFLASSGQLFIQLVTDAGSCETQPWYLPFHWRVGCKNCTDPLVQFSLGDVDCEAHEYYVNVDIFSMGSSATLTLENSLGLPATTADATGVHAVGPFPAGQSVIITAQNPDNAMCYSVSPIQINLPCAEVDCGPTTHTYCYGDNEWVQWAYQGADDQEIGIRFLRGTMGLGDDGRVYNGADPDMAIPVDLPAWGSLMNTLYTSGAPSTDHTLILELSSDAENSCASGGPVFDPSAEWEYVVACYDGCTQPRATFASTCLSQTQYNVEVTITDLGNTGSVTITNDGGAPSVTATELGTYTVGPFTAGVPATLEVEGASVLCSWTSPAQNPDCTTAGIAEASLEGIDLFPNPNNGQFSVQLPAEMGGTAELQALDLTGRVVAHRLLHGSGRSTVDLTELPNGLYTLVLRNNGTIANARISIQH